MLLVGVAVLTFASLVYFAEKDTLEGFSGGGWTFLDSFWWGIMTLTTVGYDHKSPQTFMGKVGVTTAKTNKFKLGHCWCIVLMRCNNNILIYLSFPLEITRYCAIKIVLLIKSPS